MRFTYTYKHTYKQVCQWIVQLFFFVWMYVSTYLYEENLFITVCMCRCKSLSVCVSLLKYLSVFYPSLIVMHIQYIYVYMYVCIYVCYYRRLYTYVTLSSSYFSLSSITALSLFSFNKRNSGMSFNSCFKDILESVQCTRMYIHMYT